LSLSLSFSVFEDTKGGAMAVTWDVYATLERFVGRNTWDVVGAERINTLGSIDGATEKLKN
jgi:hypothetical protein